MARRPRPPAAAVSKRDQKIIGTLQLACRWGYQSYPVPEKAENFAGNEIWELYNVNEDPTELNDVAARHPARLAQMKALFDKEAPANNVYPLFNWSDMFNGIQDFQRNACLLPGGTAPKK